MSETAERVERILIQGDPRASLSENHASVTVSGFFCGSNAHMERTLLDTAIRKQFPDVVALRINASVWHWIIAK